jgi:glycosyltransferase involved in cell wall biosynthesis
MDICFTSHRYAPLIGGYENQIKLLAQNLPPSFNVKVVTFKLTESQTFESLNNVEVYRVKPQLTFFRVPISANYLKTLDKIKFDILHSHGFIPIVSDISVFQAKMKTKRVVYTHHFDGNVQDSGILNLAANVYNGTVGRFCVRFADRIVATSKSYAETSPVLKHYMAKIQVIPLLVDCDWFRPQPTLECVDLKRQLGLTGKKIVLFVGRIVPYKGLEYLIRAFERITREIGEDFHLLIAGGGEGRNITNSSSYYQSIYQLAKRNETGKRIHFLGRVENYKLPLYYSLADVVVLPSIMRGEAFGSTLLEALACGTPVVASSIDGVKDVLNGNHYIGTYVPPRDDLKLSKAIVKMANQKDDVTERCREFAVDSYSVEKITQQYVNLYSSLS